MLRVTVLNKGQVSLPGLGICNNDDQNSAVTCTYGVNLGDALVATAKATSGGHPFERWTDATCAGQGAACTFTAAAMTKIVAQFH